MVTKGLITSIDFNGNTCEVRMPYFESAGNDKISGTAIFSNTPGSYNGYKVGDVVMVAFEDGLMDNPVVIGKLYLGADIEKADPRGSLSVENSIVAKTATIPADTNLLASIDDNVAKTTTPYASMFSVANELNTLKVSVNQQSRLFGAIESAVEEISADGSTLLTKIIQTSNRLDFEVTARENADARIAEDADKRIRDLSAELTIEAGKIAAETGEKISRNSLDEVGTYNGLGWDLSLDA